MSVKIGSARHDENGRYSGGRKGDQTGNEVSIQDFYIHKKGWYVLRPKSITIADMIGETMYRACGNPNIGYCQAHRSDIYKFGTYSSVPCECDCSSLVRQIVKEVLGTNISDFTTANEKTVLLETNSFICLDYTNNMALYKGDILVTKTKGHTVVVVSSDASRHSPGFQTDNHQRSDNSYYVGTNYTLQVELKVRTGAGTGYRAKSHNELTSGGRQHDKDCDGALDKGTVVTCLEVNNVGSDVWIRCPSGWLAAKYKGKTYIA